MVENQYFLRNSKISTCECQGTRSPFYREEFEVVDDFGLNVKAAGVFKLWVRQIGKDRALKLSK